LFVHQNKLSAKSAYTVPEIGSISYVPIQSTYTYCWRKSQSQWTWYSSRQHKNM